MVEKSWRRCALISKMAKSSENHTVVATISQNIDNDKTICVKCEQNGTINGANSDTKIINNDDKKEK